MHTAKNSKAQLARCIRVSSTNQNNVRQLVGIDHDKLFADEMTDSTKDRPQLQQMPNYVRTGTGGVVVAQL